MGKYKTVIIISLVVLAIGVYIYIKRKKLKALEDSEPDNAVRYEDSSYVPLSEKSVTKNKVTVGNPNAKPMAE